MNTESYLRRIRKEFPRLKFSSVRIPTPQGVDHVAIVLDEKWIFRFPKKQKYKKLFKKEIRLMDALHARIPLPIPHYEFVARDKSFGGYAFIPGVSLRRPMYMRMSSVAKKRVQRQMAGFLSALHATPLSIAKKYGVRRTTIGRYFTRQHGQYLRHVRHLLTAKEKKMADAHYREMRLHLHDAFTPALIHYDLHLDHILTDAKLTKITGIIDFGDRMIGDPAFDFSVLWRYGPQCAEYVFAQYTGPVDSQFFTRIKLYFREFALGGIMWADRGMFLTPTQARAQFKLAFN